jgi:hypothetical protein
MRIVIAGNSTAESGASASKSGVMSRRAARKNSFM